MGDSMINHMYEPSDRVKKKFDLAQKLQRKSNDYRDKTEELEKKAEKTRETARMHQAAELKRLKAKIEAQQKAEKKKK